MQDVLHLIGPNEGRPLSRRIYDRSDRDFAGTRWRPGLRTLDDFRSAWSEQSMGQLGKPAAFGSIRHA